MANAPNRPPRRAGAAFRRHALFTETSIGQLFIAAIVPAILTVSLYFAAVALRLFAADTPPANRSERREIRAALRRSIPVICLFALVFGGLYARVFTATESAAAGTFGALTFSFFVNVSGVPDIIVRMIANLDMAPVAVIALLPAVYLVLGCVTDSFGIMVVTLPAIVLVVLDYSLVWRGWLS